MVVFLFCYVCAVCVSCTYPDAALNAASCAVESFLMFF